MGTCNCNCVGSNIVSAGNGVSGCLPKAYTPKATGTSAERDIRDRFADIVNVKDYGAKGDPQYNDAAAWNAFLNATGGVKYIPAGDYRVANNVIKSFPEGRIVGYVREPDLITHEQIADLFKSTFAYNPANPIPDPTYL